ncbi:hypothetical protein GT347_14795 [Xylophilus rhododendri]|uniref:Uncharacterized protein n=1 Tax=Xylophilus rhododendri TaxID=2697032 RepID=A0A857J808_9BURK|nr:hypothetical protein [Xylophilus rhododendri]QHI99142.1 hypothetical protein GT347_14795 [Xylophilus rhododendri]
MPELAETAARWFIVSQVKSNRVVYFTDDPDYQPPMEGNWYFVSVFQGDLPEAMTLRNCWSWRFNGDSFQDAQEPPVPEPQQALLAANRSALRYLLREKINRWRTPTAANCYLGEMLWADKLEEARRHAAAAGEGRFVLLQSLAAARGIGLAEAAELILAASARREAVLHESEAVRERFAHAIEQADSQEALMALRQDLMDMVHPHDAPRTAMTINPMTPQEWTRPLAPQQLLQEVQRLRTQLRLAIDQLRRQGSVGCLFDETLAAARLHAALELLAGRAPSGSMEHRALAQFAAARDLPLQEAARLVKAQAEQMQELLLSTEARRDEIDAAIGRMVNLRDLQAVQKAIAAIAVLASPAAS